MYQQVWKLTSELTGNFILTNEDNLMATKPPLPSIKKMALIPQFSEQGNQTGNFNLEIEFVIDVDREEKPSTYYVADTGRNAFDYYIDALTFLSLSPVKVIKAPALTYNTPGTNQFRQISFPSQQGTISQPLPVSSKFFLSINLNNDVRRIIAWLKIGLQEKDIITSFLALFTCTEILSHKFENSDLRISRTCSKCGFEEKIRLGTKQVLHNFLINEVSLSKEKGDDLWETRNKLIHGGYDLSPANKRVLEALRNDLIIAIIRGIKKLVGLQSSDLPPETSRSFPFADPVFDIEYTTSEQ